ncbi:MAG TPA: Gfo/Idh/MocA family oxidoreductase [Sedimentibacter sp.]|nr:Gfo/Idh/MocA family oxidoreductase [Sedimentibacter sp.]HOA19800.1 Gfo/Idh/MocA family oxidoreductase [Sedimentibacter sp.]
MDTVRAGLAGAGYAAHLHCEAYKRVSGVNVRLKTIVDIDIEKAEEIRKKYNFENAVKSFDELLKDDEIDLIDIVTPPYLHKDMIIRAVNAGKHVICEKPLTGYFGKAGDSEPIGLMVSKEKMFNDVIRELDEIKDAVKKSGKHFMYAENFVYAPNVQKTAEIIRSKKSRILFMKGEESLRGSSSPLAGRWDKTGGGSFIRVGCHPLSGILWLKQEEAKARNTEIKIKSVSADMGCVSKNLSDLEKKHLTLAPVDVEDIAAVTVTFSDESKALIIAADNCLGGTRNYIDVYCNNGSMLCNITPTDILQTYFLDEEGMDDVYISEMLPSKLGWNKVFIVDEVLRGYTSELQDFMECASMDREPLSSIDLAYDAIKTIYAAYWSAEEGRRINF